VTNQHLPNPFVFRPVMIMVSKLGYPENKENDLEVLTISCFCFPFL